MQVTPFNIIPTSRNMLNHLPLNSQVWRTIHPPTSSIRFQHNVRVAKESSSKRRAIDEYHALFASQRLETSKPITLALVDGAMPPDFPSGTYYLIGPGMFSDDHGSTVHPLDGHGYLRSFEMNGANGVVKFSAKYVKTTAQKEEFDPTTGSWKFTHRGPFSVLKGGKIIGNTKVMKNVANTTVLKWGGRLFCLWEGGSPYEVQPGSLETIGRSDFIEAYELVNGKKKWTGDVLDVVACLLKPILYGIFKMPKQRMLSHYKIDVERERLLVMACNAEDMLLPRSHLTFYEFDNNFELVHKKEFKISEHLMVHDWGFTDTHYLVFGNRVKLDFPGCALASCGLSPMISALSPDSTNPTFLYLLSRHPQSNTAAITSIELPSPLWLLHVAHAMVEDRRLLIHAVVCSYKWFSFQNMFGYNWNSGKFDPSKMNQDDGQNLLPRLIQVSVDLDSSGKCIKSVVEPLSMWTRPSDFPIINLKCPEAGHQFIYAATSSGLHKTFPNFPFDSLVKVHTRNATSQLWTTLQGRFIGEPMFVPTEFSKAEDEDEGYLIVVEYAVSEGECYMVIIDAKKIGESNAVVARFVVPKYLTFPLGFHGAWDPLY